MRTMATIGAIDPTGGAGVLADVRVAGRFGVYGMGIVTAMTSQNPLSFNGIEAVSEGMFRRQIADVFGHYRVDAVKCGMIAEKWQLRMIAEAFEERGVKNLVIDPIASATLGERVMDEEWIGLYKLLFDRALIVTPNERECEIFGEFGRAAVLRKGGESGADECADVLTTRHAVRTFVAPKRKTANTHGTGCTMSAAIASCLALGMGLETAVERAHGYVARAIEGAMDLDITRGYGPLNHFVNT